MLPDTPANRALVKTPVCQNENCGWIGSGEAEFVGMSRCRSCQSVDFRPIFYRLLTTGRSLYQCMQCYQCPAKMSGDPESHIVEWKDISSARTHK